MSIYLSICDAAQIHLSPLLAIAVGILRDANVGEEYAKRAQTLGMKHQWRLQALEYMGLGGRHGCVHPT